MSPAITQLLQLKKSTIANLQSKNQQLTPSLREATRNFLYFGEFFGDNPLFLLPNYKFTAYNMEGAVAQLVEQRTENPCVAGSIPAHTTL